MKSTLLKAALPFAAIALAYSFATSAENIEQQMDVPMGGTLDLRTDAGSIEVRTHNQPYAVIEVDVRGRDQEDFEVVTQMRGDTLEVIGEVESNNWNRSLQVKFEITVPEDFNIEVDTAGGSISIDDLEGNIDARTSGGSIQVGEVHGEVELHTSGGSIKTEAIYGPLNAHTSGGSIRATFAEQLTEDASLETSGGSITAYLIKDIQVDINASTGGGSVRTDFDIDGRVKKQSIKGEINGGGPELDLHTSGGSVNIRSL